MFQRGCRPVRMGILACMGLVMGLVACGQQELGESGLQSVDVEHVYLDPHTGVAVVLLVERTGVGRVLPIWIGDSEARSIERAIQNRPPLRPNTHDLIVNLLRGLGQRVVRILVTELRDGTFYSSIEMSHGGGVQRIDARPSDAIAIAVRLDVPILVRSTVLEEAGIVPGRREAVDVDWRSARVRPRDSDPSESGEPTAA